MKKLLQTAAIAAVAATASWAMRRWLDHRYAPAQPAPKPPRKVVENWENEGGALAPHPAGHETSQVPR
ncbi:MAG: hypothetical protein ABIO63_02245 [Casimicrobiaceae bacterium]